MMEHVGVAHYASYFQEMFDKLKPGGRLLNHQITRHASSDRHHPGKFIDRYIFPDGEMAAPGLVMTRIHDAGRLCPVGACRQARPDDRRGRVRPRRRVWSGGRGGVRVRENPRDPGVLGVVLLVREGGVEPPLHFWNTDLNRARLPIPPLARAQKQYGPSIANVKPTAAGRT